ncbi:MAG TPA: oxygen-independent coproporphyrinogen III oxidase [Rhizobacter sp.]|nr:oxygen-independent coproporphyrinogen III oxidase [Rhizobacter sp.]
MSTPLQPAATLGGTISADTLRRYDVPGPRYTSYPTADRFAEGFSSADLITRLHRRAAHAERPLSLYVHIPFCESICYYCGCNKIITKDHGHAGPYLDALEHEMALYAPEMGNSRRVSQLHLGGGTPTFLNNAELSRLMASLRTCFDIVAGAELSIEVDPRTVTRERLAHLASLGFNRLSFGVQDFDERVQKAVHRIQPHDSVRDLVTAARELGFDSINVDLIYGLPMQTAESFARTIAQVNALRPDRIALYAYAHLPTRFKPQRRISVDDLPPANERVEMLSGAIAGFLASGYDYIGMDHFALPTDSLAVAKRQGRLHRNFQGYSTQPECDLVGLGVSAIGQMGDCYTQNAKTLPEYYEALESGLLPVARGLVLSREDSLRRDAIMALMCQGRLDFTAFGKQHGIDAREHFAKELADLGTLVDQGLASVSEQAIEVTATGWFFVRAVAMVFDGHLQRTRDTQRFSRIV